MNPEEIRKARAAELRARIAAGHRIPRSNGYRSGKMSASHF